jgi:hypothetical protein
MCSSCIRSPCFAIGLAVAQVAAPDLAVLVVAPIRGGRTLWRGRLVDARAIAGARQLQGVPPPLPPFLAVDPVSDVGQPPSARGTHVRTASRAPQNPAGPCGANGAVIAPSNRSSSPGTRASTRDRAYSTRSRLRNDVPDRELGRRPRLTDLAEDAPVADQLPVVTPHFRPPGARRLGGLKGTVSPTSGALHENAGRPSERPHGCNEGEQRQVGPTPTPCSSSARDHDRRDRPRECRQARNVRVGATKNDMTLSTTAVTRLQGVGATAHRTADDSAVRHVRLVAPLSHASGTFDPRSWLSRAGRRRTHAGPIPDSPSGS